MSKKVTVIGAGNVGATLAYTLSLGNIASEIVVIDINKEKVEGEVMDIVQGTSFREPISVVAGDYEDAKDSDIVIITSGKGRKPGQTRIDLAQTNVNILKEITPQIVAVAPKALYVIVSNPVDIMTYVFTKISGLPESQIIGSGTILDTARLRYDLSNHFGIAQKNIHAYVYGEHGDTSFVPWSLAFIGNNPLSQYKDCAPDGDTIKWDESSYEEMENFVKTSGAQVIKSKGATFFAVAISVCHICKCILDGAGTALTVSTMMHGEYGVDDVCLSTPAIVGRGGIRGKIMNKLTDEEIAKFQNSANKLKEVIAGLEI